MTVEKMNNKYYNKVLLCMALLFIVFPLLGLTSAIVGWKELYYNRDYYNLDYYTTPDFIVMWGYMLYLGGFWLNCWLDGRNK